MVTDMDTFSYNSKELAYFAEFGYQLDIIKLIKLCQNKLIIEICVFISNSINDNFQDNLVL